jgi:DNA-binding transcriptional LysR family regulator
LEREVNRTLGVLAELALGPVLPEITIALELDEPEAIVRAVEAGVGLAFISEVIVSRQIAAGTLVELPIDGVDLWRDFSLVTLRDRPLTTATRAFCAFIEEAWQSP